MKRTRLIGLALMAVFAISAVIASSAGAHSFVASKTGGLLLGKALATQKFVTKAGTVECTALTADGTTTTTIKTLTQKATINYSGCKAFGLTATIAPAEYEFNADGTVTVLKVITIKAVGCLVTVPAPQTLKTITYTTKPAGEVEIIPNVTGITSSGSGAACEYASESAGTYTGASLTSLDGGTVTWE